MVYHFKKFAYSFFCSAVITLSYAADVQKPAIDQSIRQPQQEHTATTAVAPTKPYHVKVLLDEHTLRDNEWIFNAPQGFVVSDPNNSAHKWRYQHEKLVVRVVGDYVVCGTKKYKGNQVALLPINKQGTITYGDNRYQGILLIVRVKDRVLLINRLDLEEYLVSVLRTESWPGWPLEVNKAFAIAARSYAMAMMLRSREAGLLYHIRNSNHHQTYTGAHEYTHLRTAVEQTKGIFLSHGNEPILAMFDSCCGGVIPAHISDFNFARAPYLARDYPCTFCKRCKLYEWEVIYPTHRMMSLIKAESPRLKHIKDIRVLKRDKAGLVHKVEIHGSGMHVHLTGRRIYSLIKEVVSFCFSVSKRADSIVFKGRGYGHHLGICQWGAREMVRDGYDYRSVLQFYYPKTMFMRYTT